MVVVYKPGGRHGRKEMVKMQRKDKQEVEGLVCWHWLKAEREGLANKECAFHSLRRRSLRRPSLPRAWEKTFQG